MPTQVKPAVLIITELYPNIDNTFLGTFIVSQIDELRKKYHIVIIVPYTLGLKRFKLRQPPIIHKKKLDVYYIKQYPLFLLMLRIFKIISDKQLMNYNKKFIRRKILRFAKILNQKYNFILTHGHESYIGDEAAMVGKLLKIPSIVTIHGLYDYHKQSFGGKVMNRVVKNLNRADRLFAVSNVAARSYQRNGVNKKQIDIIPNGLPVNQLLVSPLPVQWQKKIKNKTVILTVGFFVKEKRFEHVIEAARRLKNKYGDSFVILMIGRGDLDKTYQQLIHEGGLERHVYIVEQVHPSDMMTFYKACDFLVHPSIIESFSMACLEAASAGKPFICTNNIGLVEYITPNKEAFVIPPDDTDVLTEKMDFLLSNAELRQRMGNAARQTAERFIWKNQIQKTLAIYEQLTQTQ